MNIKGFKSSYALWVCLTEKRLKKVIYYLFKALYQELQIRITTKRVTSSNKLLRELLF